jgi:hypothetical protein
MNIGALAQLTHNGRLIKQAEEILQSAVENGISIHFENPDGTILKLQDGFKLHNFEIIVYEK